MMELCPSLSDSSIEAFFKSQLREENGNRHREAAHERSGPIRYSLAFIIAKYLLYQSVVVAISQRLSATKLHLVCPLARAQ